METLFKVLIAFLPWRIRRKVLNGYFKYKIHKSARIGISFIYPDYLEMGENSNIGHFNIAIHAEKIIIKRNSSIGRGNWITGVPIYDRKNRYLHQSGRVSSLIIDENSSIVKNHHLDCTDTISIGKFTTVAGYGSQFLTHSVDISESRQDCKPIRIGDYCFLGTDCVVLGGSSLPSYCILGAKSLLNKAFTEEYMTYAGVPSVPMKRLDPSAKYFKRTLGFIN